MKRRELIKYLKGQNCHLLRAGARHSLFINIHNHRFATVPHHSEIDASMVTKICRQLAINTPEKRS